VAAAAREEAVVLDPSLAEVLACDGMLTLCVNSHRELCGISKAGGCPLAPARLAQCARLAADEGVRMVAALRAALASAEAQAEARARARHAEAAGFGSGQEERKGLDGDARGEDGRVEVAGEGARVGAGEEGGGLAEEDEEGKGEGARDGGRETGRPARVGRRKARSVAAVLDNALAAIIKGGR
jgi:hypothetical protein